MDAAPPKLPDWQATLRKTAIWAGLLLVLYLARDFFFVAFATFLFSYLTLSLVSWGMGKLPPDRQRGRARVLLTIGVFVAALLLLFGLAALIAPPVIEQSRRLAGYLSHASPETEVARVLEELVGPSLFKQQYPNIQGETYKHDLAAFREQGVSHTSAYHDFPSFQAAAEGGFLKHFLDAEKARLRAHLLREGTASREFEQWFLTEEIPRLRRQAADKEKQPSPLARAAASAEPEVLLALARQDPATHAQLREDWLRDTVAKQLAAAPTSPNFAEQFQAYYAKWQAQAAKPSPYTFDQYLSLKKARSLGPKAFGEALDKIVPSEGEDRLRRDFEAARSHELFLQWWGASATAQFVRRLVSQGAVGGEWLERMLYSFLNVPVDLGTALLLSLFICLDFPNLKKSFASLRQTWLREAYDDTVPTLAALGSLVGRAMYSQGLIAACNACMVFIGLWLIGVEHQMLISLAVFILCLIPTLGVMLSLAGSPTPRSSRRRAPRGRARSRRRRGGSGRAGDRTAHPRWSRRARAYR